MDRNRRHRWPKGRAGPLYFGLAAGLALSLSGVSASAALIRDTSGCKALVGRTAEARRCLACVAKKGRYHARVNRPGFCQLPVAAAHKGEIDTAVGCRAKVPAATRARCLRCVAKGGVFGRYSDGPGLCRLPATTAPSAQIRTVNGCKTALARSKHLGLCLRCVAKGGVFRPRPTGPGLCHLPVKPQTPKVLRTPAACRATLAQPTKQQLCLSCVRKHGEFQGFIQGPGTCRLPPK